MPWNSWNYQEKNLPFFTSQRIIPTTFIWIDLSADIFACWKQKCQRDWGKLVSPSIVGPFKIMAQIFKSIIWSNVVQFLRHSKYSINNVYSYFIIISLGLQLFWVGFTFRVMSPNFKSQVGWLNSSGTQVSKLPSSQCFHLLNSI